MNQHLKQAIAAAHAGKKPQAKVLLARVIKDEPENANAWFLLSSLADTDEQKIQHLQKVLDLQPDHPAAADQLAKLAPMPPEPVEEVVPEPIIESFEALSEDEDDIEITNIFPLPEIDVPDAEEPAVEVPDDPDEAMAWLERLAADQGASLDELPSLSDMPFESELEPEYVETLEPASGADSDVTDEPDDAMAWLEQLAADQGAPFDELPAMTDGDAMADTITGLEDDFSWLDDDSFEEDEFPEPMEPMMDEEEVKDEAPARTLKISKDLDFVDQSKGDSIPVWLAEDEDLISADTVMTQAPVEEEEAPEPENLPDWLTDESFEEWAGEEGEKSGQVVWKAGEGDDSKRPAPPPTEKKAAPAAAKQTAAPKNNTLILAGLFVLVFILILAILYILVYQPF